MILNILTPSPLEVKMLSVPEPDENGTPLISVRPIQYQKSQRTLYTLPIDVRSEGGELLDRAFLTVNSRSGRMSLEHRMEVIDCPVDEEEKAEPVKPKSAPKEEKSKDKEDIKL